MPTLVEINGIDEGGRIGENIYFVRVGVRIDNEIQLLLRNLDYFGKLLVRKDDLFGRDEKNLQKYLRDSFDDPCVSVSIFRMHVHTQMQILETYLKFLSEELFKARGTLIDSLKSILSNRTNNEENSTDLDGTSKVKVWQVIDAMKRFEQYPFIYELLVKSYGMMRVTAKLDGISDLFRTKVSEGSRYMLVVQIDGGYPFAFWWQQLLESSNLSNMKKGNVHIAGVSQGDAFYPAMSTAGALAYVINRYPQRAFFLPVTGLTYDEEFPLNDEYYFKHTTALTRPIFDERIVFIGQIDTDLELCLLFCLQRANRKKPMNRFI